MERADLDKLTERYTFAIPKKLSDLLRGLGEAEHDRLRQRLRYEMARAVHSSLFDSDLYLTSSPDPVQNLLGKLIGKNIPNGKPSQFREDDTP